MQINVIYLASIPYFHLQSSDPLRKCTRTTKTRWVQNQLQEGFFVKGPEKRRHPAPNHGLHTQTLRDRVKSLPTMLKQVLTLGLSSNSHGKIFWEDTSRIVGFFYTQQPTLILKREKNTVSQNKTATRHIFWLKNPYHGTPRHFLAVSSF